MFQTTNQYIYIRTYIYIRICIYIYIFIWLWSFRRPVTWNVGWFWDGLLHVSSPYWNIWLESIDWWWLMDVCTILYHHGISWEYPGKNGINLWDSLYGYYHHQIRSEKPSSSKTGFFKLWLNGPCTLARTPNLPLPPAFDVREPVLWVTGGGLWVAKLTKTHRNDDIW